MRDVMRKLIETIRRFGRDPKPPTTPASPGAIMTVSESALIRFYADGHQHLHDSAVAIYRAYLPTLGRHGSPEMSFMSEVDTPVPDLGLRARYRAALKEAA